MARKVIAIVAVIVVVAAVGLGFWALDYQFFSPSAPGTNAILLEAPGFLPRPSVKAIANMSTAANVSLGNPSTPQNYDKTLLLPPPPDVLMVGLPDPLVKWLTAWNAAELKGNSADEAQIAELKTLLESPDVPVAAAAKTIALVGMMDGNALVAPLCEHVTARAAEELKDIKPGDPAVQKTIDALRLLQPVLTAAGMRTEANRVQIMVRPWDLPG